MIGLGLSLCGACVMADADESARPLYQQARGYYISQETRLKKFDTIQTFFSTALPQGIDVSDVYIRIAVRHYFEGSVTMGLCHVYTDDGVLARNHYVQYNGFYVIQSPTDVWRQHMNILGDCLIDSQAQNGKAVASASRVAYQLKLNYTEVGAKAGSVTIFRVSQNLSEKSAYRLGVTRAHDKLYQLVYALSSARGYMEQLTASQTRIAAIELIDKRVVEI